MSWEIKVWHEEAGERTRLSIEANSEVPEDVVSVVVGSYWLEQVQFIDGDDEETDTFEDGFGSPDPRFQG